MHPYLVDWFRGVHINPDPKVVEKRWSTAQEFGKDLSRTSVIALLRLFLFADTDEAQIKLFTDRLLAFDTEFPVAKNEEELRLMAGVVMLTEFARSSNEADAFALGFRASSFPGRRLEPAESGIILQGQQYLITEAVRLRPHSFEKPEPAVGSELAKLHKALRDAAADQVQLAKSEAAYHDAIAEAVNEGNEDLFDQVRRLAEETALLWWVIGEFSTSLRRRTPELSVLEYALVAGSEAAERTDILPPPNSAAALLSRALKPCKRKSKKQPTLQDFIGAADIAWSSELLKTLHWADCGDLVPVITALAKCKEFGDASAAINVLPRLCPGITLHEPISAEQVSSHIYDELMFLRVLDRLRKD